MWSSSGPEVVSALEAVGLVMEDENCIGLDQIGQDAWSQRRVVEL